MICPKCGTKVRKGAFCYNCGENLALAGAAPVSQAPKKKGKIVLFVIIGLVLVGASVFSLIYGLGQTKAKDVSSERKLWKFNNYIDEFGDKVEDEWYLEGKFRGKFNNSATTNSECVVRIFYDYNGYCGAFIYDYGSEQLKNWYDEKTYYTVLYKDSDEETRELSAYMKPNGDRVYFNNYEPFLEAISRGDVKVSITDNDDTLNVYRFEIKKANFVELYETIEQ